MVVFLSAFWVRVLGFWCGLYISSLSNGFGRRRRVFLMGCFLVWFNVAPHKVGLGSWRILFSWRWVAEVNFPFAILAIYSFSKASLVLTNTAFFTSQEKHHIFEFLLVLCVRLRLDAPRDADFGDDFFDEFDSPGHPAPPILSASKALEAIADGYSKHLKRAKCVLHKGLTFQIL